MNALFVSDSSKNYLLVKFYSQHLNLVMETTQIYEDINATAGEKAFLGANRNARCGFASGQAKSYFIVTQI